MADITPQDAAAQVGGIVRSIPGVDTAAVDTGGDIGEALGSAIGAATPLGAAGPVIGRLAGQVIGAIVAACNQSFIYPPGSAQSELALESASSAIVSSLTAMPEPQRTQLSDQLNAAYLKDVRDNGVLVSVDPKGHTSYGAVPCLLPSANAPGGHWTVELSWRVAVTLAQAIRDYVSPLVPTKTIQSVKFTPTARWVMGGGAILAVLASLGVYLTTRRNRRRIED